MTMVDARSLESAVLTGTAYERGFEHGERFADEIRTNVDAYLDRFAYLGADEETVREQGDEFTALFEEVNETYTQEMKGVSEGSGVPLQEIVILNARWEVMYSALKDTAEPKPETDGCTGFGVQPETTATGHTYMGQNWDWIPSIEIFVMDVRRPEKPNLIAMTEAGIVGGKIGLNEAGIGITVNGLISAADGDDPFRKPMHVRFREALDASRFDGAVAPFITDDRAVSANVMIGHRRGEFIDLELAPERVNYLFAEDGLLTHANHFETDTIQSEFEKLLPDTLCRAPRIRRLLSQSAGEIDTDTLESILRDHFNRPASICRHPDESVPEEEQYQTDGSFVLDLTDGRMFATRGPPCEADFDEFRVGD